MKLPPALLERLKTSNMMGLGEKEGLQYIKSGTGKGGGGKRGEFQSRRSGGGGGHGHPETA